MFVEHLRRADFLVVGGEAPAHVGDKRLKQSPTLGMPEHRAWPLLLEMEQIHFARQAPVVALLRLLELLQMSVELLLASESRTVDARQHRPVGIAAPIGAGDFHQLERVADLARRGHMRPAAEIEPIALGIELDLLVGGNGVEQFDLERLALLLEQIPRRLARDCLFGERLVARDDLAHALLDRREILGRERRVAKEIVIETVLDHRADGDLRTRPQRLHRLRQHMRGVVADEFQRARVLARHELDASIVVDWIGEIGERAVHDHRDRALGERGRDRFGDFGAGAAGFVGARGAVGESNVDHVDSWLTRRNVRRKRLTFERGRL